jgi:hypothetical protein
VIRNLLLLTMLSLTTGCEAPSKEKNMTLAQFGQITRSCGITDAQLEPLQISNKITVYWKAAYVTGNSKEFQCLNRELNKTKLVYGIQFQ